MTIDDVHKELHFVQYEPGLRNVPAIWKSLQQKQAEAKKEPNKVKSYKAFLERCIAKLREDTLTEAQVDDAVKEFFQWYDKQVRAHKIDHIESLRYPRFWEQWCEKNLQKEWAELMLAWSAVVDQTSKRTLENLKRAYSEMMTAYTTFHA